MENIGTQTNTAQETGNYEQQASAIIEEIKSIKDKQEEVVRTVTDKLLSLADSDFSKDMYDYGVYPKDSKEMKDLVCRIGLNRVDTFMEAIENNINNNPKIKYDFNLIKSMLDKYRTYLDVVSKKINELSPETAFDRDLLKFGKDFESELGGFNTGCSVDNHQIYQEIRNDSSV